MWLVHDRFHDDFTGPFPTQDQAMSYAEAETKRVGHIWGDDVRFECRQLTPPCFMPEPTEL